MTTPDGPNSDATQLIQALRDNARRLGLTWQIILATVVDASDGSNIVVRFDTDESDTRGIFTMVPVSAGTRVFVMQVPPAGNYIVGYAGAMAPSTVLNSFVGGSVQTKNTGTFSAVNGPGGTPFGVSINKKHAGTALLVQASGSFYSTTSASTPLFSVMVSGVSGPDSGSGALTLPSHWVGYLGIANSSLNSHTPWAGSALLPGLTAGKATVQLQWRRDDGTGVLTMDTRDCAFLTVSEVWPS